MCYEWFYANIDEPFFHHKIGMAAEAAVAAAPTAATTTSTSMATIPGSSKFIECVRQSFPQLKTHRLTQIEWNKIRRLLGKRRRCSPSFFLESRKALERYRRTARLQQQQMANTSDIELNELNEMGCCNDIIAKPDVAQQQCQHQQHYRSRRLASGCKVSVLTRPNGNNDLRVADGVVHCVDGRPQPMPLPAAAATAAVYMVKLDATNELRAMSDFDVSTCFNDDADTVGDSGAEAAATENRQLLSLSTSAYRAPKHHSIICQLKQHLLAKSNKLQLLKICQDEYRTMQMHGDADAVQEEVVNIAAVINCVYRDIDALNSSILNCWQSILACELGREAIAPLGDHCTSTILMKELEKKTEHLVEKLFGQRNGAAYTAEIRRCFVSFSRMLGAMMIDQFNVNGSRDTNSTINLRVTSMLATETIAYDACNADSLHKLFATQRIN